MGEVIIYANNVMAKTLTPGRMATAYTVTNKHTKK